MQGNQGCAPGIARGLGGVDYGSNEVSTRNKGGCPNSSGGLGCSNKIATNRRADISQVCPLRSLLPRRDYDSESSDSESSDSEEDEIKHVQMARQRNFGSGGSLRAKLARARFSCSHRVSIPPLASKYDSEFSDDFSSSSSDDGIIQARVHSFLGSSLLRADTKKGRLTKNYGRSRRELHSSCESNSDSGAQQNSLPFLRNSGYLPNEVNSEPSGSGPSDSEHSGSGPSDSEPSESKYEQSILDPTIPTESAILSYGLAIFPGFDEKKQQRVRHSLNISRFKSHYGVGPETVHSLYIDLKKQYRSIEFRYYMLTLNWLKLYSVEHVLSGRWGYCEDTIRVKVKEYARMIQSLKPQKIVFDGWEDDEIHIISVDGCNFMTQEFRLDPSAKWFDHKTKSAGLTYEFAVAIRRNKLVWMKGPEPAGSKHDITHFRGGTKEQGKDKWDKNSLYFKLPPGKRGVGDSGYGGEPDKVTVTKAQHSREFKKFMSRAKNRQESFHSRIKSFNVLGHRFRHGSSTKSKMDLHKTCTEAVCVIIQIDMEHGRPLMDM